MDFFCLCGCKYREKGGGWLGEWSGLLDVGVVEASGFDEAGGVATDDGVVWDVFEDGGCGSDDGVGSDCDTRSHECSGCDPCEVVDGYGSGEEGVERGLVVVGGSAEV